jgi:DNA-binding PadR family transcriptional regulator
LLDDGLIERAGEEVIGEGKVRKPYRLTGLGARTVNARIDDEQRTLARLRAAVPRAFGWMQG